MRMRTRSTTDRRGRVTRPQARRSPLRRALALLGVSAVVLTACTASEEPEDDAVPPAPSDTEALDQEATGNATPRGDAVTVVGHGEARGEPDVVVATVGVEVSADSAERALDTASTRTSEVIDALRDAGVAQEDIRTEDISLREERDRPPRRAPEGEQPGEERTDEPAPEPEIVAQNVLEVRIRDVEDAGAVLSQVSEAAGELARIRGIRFEVSDPEPLLETAREEAFADARTRAEQYAQLADRELGALLSIREHGAAPGPVGAPRPEQAEDADVPVEPGTQAVNARITAVWSLG